ncbi:MAG: hypothetical protein AAF909_07905 [Pseudomonadota bacterium]
MKTTRRGAVAGLVAAGALNTMIPGRSAQAAPRDYRGPNVVIVRFGGGVRRRETIEAAHSYAPRLLHRLAPRGVLIPDLRIEQLDGVDTSHAEGTLNILTGRYRAYRPGPARTVIPRLEPTEPTLFEMLRRAYDIPAHQTLLINGEDRPQEEYFAYGVHRNHGVAYRSEVLSLHRFKLWRLRETLAEGRGAEAELTRARDALARLERQSRGGAPKQSAEIDALWRRWRAVYGEDGLRNPRGDRALTELALWALRLLRPRLMMINYQDPDYVHWGNPSHYTRAIAGIDADLARLAAAVDADEGYRDNTLFCVVPDCGRDANPLMEVPFQHHFNSRSAHEIWALFFGPGITRGRVLDRPVDQTAIAPTLAAAMGAAAPRAEHAPLSELFA